LEFLFPRTVYEIAVENPDRVSRGTVEALLDGVAVDAAAIPLVDDGETHRVRVVMRDPAPRSVALAAAAGDLPKAGHEPA